MCIDRPETARARYGKMKWGKTGRGERKRCEVTHLGTGCNVSRPGGHHSAALSRVLFKGKQISGGECHCKDTRGLISTNQCRRFQITFSPSLANKSIFLIPAPCFTPPFDPWRPRRWGRRRATDLRSPPFRSGHDLLTLAISFLFEGLHMELILTTS